MDTSLGRHVYRTLAITALLALLVALWAPWLPNHGDRKFLESFRASDVFRNAEERSVSDIYCKGLDVSWSPFGRTIAYCDHAVWQMDILGALSAAHIEQYVSNPQRNARLRTFAYFKDGTAHSLCRAWSIHDPVLVTAEYSGIDEPMPADLGAKARFKGENGEFFLILPYDAIAKRGYARGKKYTVDMNNLCIYEHRFLKTEPIDPEWANYVLPAPTD
jgi:hypothetical protein